ncbi:MAG: 16S rRNA (cytosine(1402)-N(4))-methyltransferase RsmH [Planctomycetota bacterium]|nr:16S rRNA (cytosine(1402)-N(4))-methyltransferase RsmH [Planctomycetota bacterium]MEC8512805.1 16S rRNA (cytosine(1402)-N(4))-methyltransferase RsmH [Planctomycetota bacterium]
MSTHQRHINDRRAHARPVPIHARPAGAAPRVLTLSVFDAMTDPLSDRPVHVPVLAEEVARLLGGRRSADSVSGLLVDVTLGAGGHSALLLERFPRLRLLGTDQDPEILSVARERLEPFQDRVRIEHARMSELTQVLADLDEQPAALLMDLGASSLQLDRPERGFSFAWDGPLDMRMDPRRSRTAADIVNTWDEGDLADLFFHEGGERGARKVARALVEARRRAPFRRTRGLSEAVAIALGKPIRSGGDGPRRGSIHPATRVFQALRRAVNEEADELESGLAAAREHLAPDGQLLAISFHSGEDGVVKRFLAEGARAGEWVLETRRPVEAGPEEVRRNPRSRSAKLRVARRPLSPSQGDTTV